jgi:branched-chain amino acid transport system ATP-binding protein
MTILSLRHINTGYGKKQVLFDVDLNVKQGKILLLIGSNGSGKSTLFKAIYGVIPHWISTSKSEVVFDGVDITKAPGYKLIGMGLMYVPQKNELFEDMTVRQNLEMSLLHLNDHAELRSRINDVLGHLEVLKGKQRQTVNQLSGGERKLLSLGMVLVNRPKLLLYDEPLAGLSGTNVKIVLDWLQKLKEMGTTMVIIEHRIKELLNLADEVIGLRLGRRNREVLNNIESIKSFMV